MVLSNELDTIGWSPGLIIYVSLFIFVGKRISISVLQARFLRFIVIGLRKSHAQQSSSDCGQGNTDMFACLSQLRSASEVEDFQSA